jgi:hypothetical protein
MHGISVHPNAPFSRLEPNMVEGFTGENMFKQVLVLPKSNIRQTSSVPGRSSGVTNTKSGTCAAPTPPTAAPVAAAGASAYTPPPFLKEMIKNEKEAVESLLRTAAKIGPIANNIVEEESASDAAFKAKIPAPIPTYSSTLQGFTFVLFFWSFVSFAIVIAIYINQTTGNTMNAVGTFIGSIVAMTIIFALMKRYA